MAIKRLRYFKYQFLQENDFSDEQGYHRSMRRRHNKDYHTWGRVSGLEVAFVAGERKVTISPGMAMDGEGQEIILEANLEVDLQGYPGQVVYLSLLYLETASDPVELGGVSGNTRTSESFQLNIVSAATAPSWDVSRELILAKVTLNAAPLVSDGAVVSVDESERREAGAKIGESSFPGLRLLISGHSAAECPELLGTKLSAPGSGRQGLRVEAARTTFSGNVSVAQNLEVTGDLTVNASGSVGIGTTSPASSLDVGGTSNAAFIQNLAAWGLNARVQGIVIMPEGDVSDDGAGNLEIPSTIIMNPLSGSWIRVQAGTYAIGAWGSLWAPLPPTGARGTTVAPSVLAWADADRNFDGRDRVLLAQRQSAGVIYTRFGVRANYSGTAGAYFSGNVGIGTTNPEAKLEVVGDISLKTSDTDTIRGLSLSRQDEGGRRHQWGLWHMIDRDYHRKNALEIWEYKTDSAGVSCGGDIADGAMCTPRLCILEGGRVGIGTTSPASSLDVGGTSNEAFIQNLAAWGLNARVQGILIMPEGDVTDDGAGNLKIPSTIIMNPLSGSWIRVQAGTYSIGVWGSLWAPLPPTGARGTMVAPSVLAWADADRNFDGRDCVLLAQRQGGGVIYTRFGVRANYSGTSGAYFSGNVGIGTTAPNAMLEVPGGAIFNGVAIGVDPPGDVTFPYAYETVGTTDPRWNLRLHSYLGIYFHAGNSTAMQFGVDANGTWYGSTLEMKRDVGEFSAREALEILAGLDPVVFAYKADESRRRHVGFIAENVPEIIASTDRKMISERDILAVLTKVVKEHEQVLGELRRAGGERLES